MTRTDRTAGGAAATGRDIDPITLSTVWHGFQSIGREMRHVIDRTAQSYLIAQLHDMAAGIWDVHGNTIAVPEGPTSMFLSQGFTVRYIMEKMGHLLKPGDVILCNDPYKGYCNHLPDWGFFRPVFYQGELLFIVLTRGHQMDTGGAFPGGYFPNGYDIHAEGIDDPAHQGRRRRVSSGPMCWSSSGTTSAGRKASRSTTTPSWPRSRSPTTGSSRCSTSTARTRSSTCVDEMMDRMETSVRGQLSAVPDGTWSGESSTDDDGTVLDEQVTVRCDATIRGRRTHPRLLAQRRAPQGLRQLHLLLDLQPGGRRVVPLLRLRARRVPQRGLDACRSRSSHPRGPWSTRPIPATVGGSPVNVGTQVLEATVNALSKAMPDKAIAGWGRRRGHYIAGTDPRTGERYVQTTTDADGGAGAVHGFDGYEGALGMSGLGSINRGSVEEIEIRFPWRTAEVALPAGPVGGRGVAGCLRHALGGREPGWRRGCRDRIVRW